MKAVAVVLVVAAALPLVPAARLSAQNPPVFRSAVEAVTVAVSVRRGGRPVTDLGEADFVVADNGVPQRIGAFAYERLPIDTTIVFDVSGSVTGPVLEQLRRSVTDLRASLRLVDRLRLVVFNTRIQRLFDVDTPATALDGVLASIVPGGGSAVADALAVTLAASSAAASERRHLIVLFSDGKDSGSVTTADTLVAMARRTTPTVSVVMASPTPMARTSVYADLAAETGGTLVSLLPTDTLGGSLRRAVDQFRSSYILTYSPTGVPRSGAHAIEVKVNRPGLDVRARRGYDLP